MSDAQLSFRKSANIDRVTDKRKDSLFRLVDTDGSGTIDAQEFAVLYDAIKKDLAEELEKEAALAKEASSAKRRFKMLLLFVAVLVSFLAASVAANFAVIFTVVDQAITTTTTSTGLLEVKGSDTIAKTAAATQDVPLIIAPALDFETLAQTQSLKVSYREDEYDESIVQTQFAIVAVRKHNDTYVEFVTDVQGEIIEVLNGGAYLTVHPTAQNGIEHAHTYSICSANATCSAFRASGIDVDAALDLAKEQLAAAGFEEEARRLAPDYGVCYSGSWTTSLRCGWEYLGFYVLSGASAQTHNFKFIGYCYDGDLDQAQFQNVAVNTVINYVPNMAGLLTLYWSGWGAMKHIVFFAHGKWGYYWSLWDTYCTPHSYTGSDCSALTVNSFKHLVFAFGSSGLIDAGTSDYAGAQGWSTDVDDSSLYATAANVLSNKLSDTVKGSISALNCMTQNIRRCTYVATGLSGMSGVYHNTYSYQRCYWHYSTYCPFNHRTEMMIIGYSDGGGLAMYMGYSSALVTKTVSIDYWAYGGYEQWIPSNPSSQINAAIYAACESDIFDDGPQAILPDASPAGQTYVSGAGLTAGALPTAATTNIPGPTGGWMPFTWSSGSKNIAMLIHGLNAPTSLGNSESSHWGGSACSWGTYGSSAHSLILDDVSPAYEIGAWLTGTTLRRRLGQDDATEEEPQLLEPEKRQLYTSKTFLKDAATESYISAYPYAKTAFGSFVRKSYRLSAAKRAAFSSIAKKAAPLEKAAMDFAPGMKKKK